MKSLVLGLVASSSLTLTDATAQVVNGSVDYSASMTQMTIIADALGDMTPSHYYNRPGSSIEEFYKNWQRCRMIARGASPSIGSDYGVLGGLLADAIAGGELRRRNRKRCMLIEGWRIIEPEQKIVSKIEKMSEADRTYYFSKHVGEINPSGTVIDWQFINPDIEVSKKIDNEIDIIGSSVVYNNLSSLIIPENDKGIIIFGFRRPTAASMGVATRITFRRYDIDKRELYNNDVYIENISDSAFKVISKNKNAQYEIHVLSVKAGWYALDATLPWQDEHFSGSGDNCLGAPVLKVAAGDVIYGGDFIPVKGLPMKNGSKFRGVVWADHFLGAQAIINSTNPSLVRNLESASWKNGATYQCKGPYFDQFFIPGFDKLPPRP